MSVPVVFVVTEDSGKAGRAAVIRLLERLICDVEFKTPQDDSGLAAGPAMWKPTNGIEGDRKRRLMLQIATRLGRGQRVVFHYDGDAPWSDRRKLRAAQFERAWVMPCVALSAKAAGIDTTHLVQMVPHWSIEAWLFRAVAKARELCEGSYSHNDRHSSLALLAQWAANPSLLDDHAKPKDCLCLSNKHNEVLAAEVDLHQLDAAKTSFTAFVDALVDAGLTVRTRT